MDDEFEKQVREEAEREAALRRQPKKKPIHEMPESLAPVAWSSSRPRPVSFDILNNSIVFNMSPLAVSYTSVG